MSTEPRVIDTNITPFWRTELEPHQWMPEPWKSKRHFPGILRQLYSAPTGIPPYGEYLDSARTEETTLPGSSMAKVIDKMDSDGTVLGVLNPLTRGPQPDQDMASVLCAATNEWLSATWLADPEHGKRFVGTIRVNPSDPEAAVREIHKWGQHPGMVQVGVPLDALRPYGQRNYFPIWEAAHQYGLPIAVHSDGGAAANLKPTIVGYPRKHISYAAQESTNFVYHAASFVMEGVFERLPNLKVIFADGGHDLSMTLMWRMDIDFAISRHEVPWMTKEPGKYLDHFVFRTNQLEGPPDDVDASDWYDMSRAAELLVYGSNYPHWTTMTPAELPRGLAPEQTSRILFDNALSLYAPRLAQIGNHELLSTLGAPV